MRWNLDTIQQGFIFDGPVLLDAYAAWSNFFGQGPSGFQASQGPSSPGGHAHGVVEGRQVTVACQMGRIDLTVSALPDFTVATGMNFIDEKEAQSQIVAWTPKISDYCLTNGNVVRMTCVSNYAFPTSNYADSAKIILELLPDLKCFALEDNLDFNFLMNKRIRSKLTGLDLNRLVSWQSFQSQFVEFAVNVGSPSLAPKESELYAVVHRLDINNVPAASGIKGPELADLAQEMIEETKRVVREGVNGY